MPRNFADRLLDEIDRKRNPSCVGLDPTITEIPETLKKSVSDEFKLYETEPQERIPAAFKATGEALFRFNKAIIDATHSEVAAFKPNIAFYECYGPDGVAAYWRTVDYVMQKGALAIADMKREDIGKTASFYAKGALGTVELVNGASVSSLNADAITLGPYVGSDSVGEFTKVCGEFGKGAFILDKTSNPSSGELQDTKFDARHGGRTVYEQMALLIDQWGAPLKGERGYTSLGAVVGATYPEQAKRCREMMENSIVLVPGYGTQGGAGLSTMPNFNEDGYGAIVNNASALIFAYKRPGYREKFGEAKFAEAAREAALAMREDIVGAMKSSGKLPAGW